MKNEIKRKNVVQDVVPPNKKSIRNVELPSRRRTQPETQEIIEPSVKKESSVRPMENMRPVEIKPIQKIQESAPVIPESSFTYVYDEPQKKSKKVMYTVTALILLVAAF